MFGVQPNSGGVVWGTTDEDPYTKYVAQWMYITIIETRLRCHQLSGCHLSIIITTDFGILCFAHLLISGHLPILDFCPLPLASPTPGTSA